MKHQRMDEDTKTSYEIKKMRKEVRKETERIQRDFRAHFKITDYVRTKPKHFPKWLWNFSLNWLFNKKK